MAKVKRYRFCGDAIKARRVRVHMSQDDLAKWSGTNQHYLSMIERGGHVPSVVKFANIAGALGCKPAELFAACTGRRDRDRDLAPSASSALSAFKGKEQITCLTSSNARGAVHAPE